MVRVLILIVLVAAAGCDTCPDYCDAVCACTEGAAADCPATCLDTLDLYPEHTRSDECSARLESIETTGECR